MNKQLGDKQKKVELKGIEELKDLIDWGRLIPIAFWKNDSGKYLLTFSNGIREYWTSIDRKKWRQMSNKSKADIINYAASIL